MQESNSNPNNNTSSSTNGSTNGVWDRLGTLANQGLEMLGKLLKLGNRRQLILRNREGVTWLSMPLTLAAIIGIILLLRAAPLLILALVLGYVFKVKFVISKQRPYLDTDSTVSKPADDSQL